MATKNNKKKRTALSQIGRGLLFGCVTIIVLVVVIIALALYEDSGFGKYADVNASLLFNEGFVKIAHGGYFKLNYEGSIWTEDFGSGFTPQCKFSRIKLKKNKKAHIKVSIKNGWGVVTWTKEQDFYLTEGDNPVVFFAEQGGG